MDCTANSALPLTEGLSHLESQRRESFAICCWPSDSNVSAYSLAAAGFYAVGRNVVRCFSCGCEVRSWSPGDRPLDVHKRISKSCDFAWGRQTSNVSFHQEEEILIGSREEGHREETDVDDDDDDDDDDGNGDINGMRLTGQQGLLVYGPIDDSESDSSLDDDTVDVMADNEMRLTTFVNSGWPNNCPVSPMDLAKAGFYYIGPGDRVKCYSCARCVECWEHGDSPIAEHRRRFPHCTFVRMNTPDTGDGYYDHERPLIDIHENNPRMNEEAARLATFADWPAPVKAIVLPGALARAGFYYTGTGDTVRCAFCLVCIRHWETGDLAFRRHRRESPACPLVLCTCASNVPLKESAHHDQEEGPVKDMHYEAFRLATFSTWPAQLAISSSELASAGFYYAGIGDLVRCFACGGTLNDWEPGQVAIQRHAICFPNCPFVMGTQHDNIPVPGPPPLPERELQQMRLEKVRAQSFATWPRHAAVSSDELVEAGFYYTCHGDVVRCFCCHVELCHWKTWHTAWGRHREVSPDCMYVQQSCPADPEAYAASFYRSHSGTLPVSSLTPSPQVSAWSNPQPHVDPIYQQSHPVSKPRHPALDPVSSTLPAQQSDHMFDPIPRCGSEPCLGDENAQTTDELRNELQQLRDSQLCKVCMERERTHMFLPCAHAVCCEICANTLKACPFCRQPSGGTLRVFVL